MGFGRRVFVVSTDDTVYRFSVQRFDRLHSDAGAEVLLHYSHPPVLQRIEALRAQQA